MEAGGAAAPEPSVFAGDPGDRSRRLQQLSHHGDLLDCDNAATMETYALHFGASGKDVVSLDDGGAHLGSLTNNCFSFYQ